MAPENVICYLLTKQVKEAQSLFHLFIYFIWKPHFSRGLLQKLIPGLKEEFVVCSLQSGRPSEARAEFLETQIEVLVFEIGWIYKAIYPWCEVKGLDMSWTWHLKFWGSQFEPQLPVGLTGTLEPRKGLPSVTYFEYKSFNWLHHIFFPI